jgi:hypothetical protein
MTSARKTGGGQFVASPTPLLRLKSRRNGLIRRIEDGLVPARRFWAQYPIVKPIQNLP